MAHAPWKDSPKLMDSTRRYSEQEIADILDSATEVQTSASQALSLSTGMTLNELQEIGREVGISTDLIARAAARLDASPASTLPSREFLGANIGVGRTMNLDRRLTDKEWDRLVVDLRETFDARGRVSEEGAFRQWTNGNLHALLEPTESGERLRLRTVKGNARPMMGLGVAVMGLAPLTYLVDFLGGGVGGPVGVGMPILFAAMGSLLYGATRLRLPRWAATRKSQMDGVADRLAAAINTGDDPAEAEDD